MYYKERGSFFQYSAAKTRRWTLLLDTDKFSPSITLARKDISVIINWIPKGIDIIIIKKYDDDENGQPNL